MLYSVPSNRLVPSVVGVDGEIPGDGACYWADPLPLIWPGREGCLWRCWHDVLAAASMVVVVQSADHVVLGAHVKLAHYTAFARAGPCWRAPLPMACFAVCRVCLSAISWARRLERCVLGEEEQRRPKPCEAGGRARITGPARLQIRWELRPMARHARPRRSRLEGIVLKRLIGGHRGGGEGGQE